MLPCYTDLLFGMVTLEHQLECVCTEENKTEQNGRISLLKGLCVDLGQAALTNHFS